MLRIAGIQRGTAASRAGLRRGDLILSCDGIEVGDWLALRSCTSGYRAEFVISRGGVNRRVSLTRSPGADWGIELEDQRPSPCRNHCIFCFMDQMPPGMRPSLSYKDDDIRYSFEHGTYVTLDGQQAMEAAGRRFSPVHVSVHCTDPDLRGFILGRRAPAPILPQLSFLAERHIEIQAQIVVMPGINDGRVLETTLEDLYRTGSVTQTGVVPVGLTRYREGLHPLSRPRPDEALAVVRMCEGYNGLAVAERGGGWCWAADEFYAIAGLPIPATDSYEGCTLQANGIGLLAGLVESCRDRRFEGGGTLVTGSLAAPFIRELVAGSRYSVLEVRNDFFGPEVGVAGLLTGADVVRTASEAGAIGGPLYLPSVMFSHEGLTLDDLTAEELSCSTGLEVHVEHSIQLLP